MPLRAILCAFFLLLGSMSASALQFSADIVQIDKDGARNSGKVHVLDGKVRIEITSFPDGFFLLDGANNAYFIRRSNRTYMEARQSSPLTRLMVSIDPDHPCQQWQEMALRAGSAGQDEAGQDDSWQCERMKEGTVAGRLALKYRVTASGGRELMSNWVDLELRFPLKVQLDDGTDISISNISTDQQPPELFEIPAGFHKFDPEALIRQIRHSDVWVEDPSR
jgi:hypothetical protein